MDAGPLAVSSYETWLIRAFYRTQAFRAARRLAHGRIVMAMYHGFTAADSHEGIANHEGKHVHVRQFREHLAFLKQHHNVVPLADVVRALRGGAPLPERAAVITIDDGYRSIYTVAYPALREFGLPASVFLTTAFVDNREYLWTDRVEFAVNRAAASVVDLEVGTTALSLDLRTTAGKRAAESRLRGLLKSMPQESRPGALEAIERATGGTLLDAAGGTSLYEPLTWDEAAEMARAGLVSIGSHTHTHVIIARCDPARAAEELRTSKRIIEGRLGMPCTALLLPERPQRRLQRRHRRGTARAGLLERVDDGLRCERARCGRLRAEAVQPWQADDPGRTGGSPVGPVRREVARRAPLDRPGGVGVTACVSAPRSSRTRDCRSRCPG